MGRRKDSSLVSYAEASSWVQAEHIGSRKQYWNFIDRERPIGLPKHPNKVYTAEWSSWNDFLGTNNAFMEGDPYAFRPYREALVYAHMSGIKTAKEWFAHDHPKDIPVRPEYVYRSKGWLGWYSFLGTGPQAAAHKVAAQQETIELRVIALTIPHGYPNNIIGMLVASSKEVAIERCTGAGARILKMFKLDAGYDWKGVMDRFGTPYGDNEWIVSNVNELIWEYSNDLLFV